MHSAACRLLDAFGLRAAMPRAVLAIWPALAAASATFGQGLPCGYEIDFINGPGCGGSSVANAYGGGISPTGDVCGWYACPGGLDNAFISLNAGALVPLTLPPGSSDSRATDVVGSVIVGHYAGANGRRGFRSVGGVVTIIQPLSNGNWVEVNATNAGGILVGGWGNNVAPPNVYPRAFRWEAGVMQDLAAAMPAGDSISNGISDNGAITGYMGQTAFPSNAHAFIWENGVVTDLGLMPGSFGTEGHAINDSREVAGIAWFTATNSAGYVRRGFRWKNGVFTDLGTLPGLTEVFPSRISPDGTITGWLQDAPGGSGQRSFVWKAGVLRAITPMLVTADTSIYVMLARDINAAGEIADTADTFNHANWAVRLRPVVRRHGDTNCDTVVNVNDLLSVIQHWGQSGVDADLNTDFRVDVNDLLIVINNWG